jgi:YggT family protein
LSTVLYVIYIVVMIYAWLIVARAIISWFRVPRGNPILPVQRTLFRLTEPYLRLFRRLPITRIGSVGIDLSSLAGLIVLFVAMQVVIRL